MVSAEEAISVVIPSWRGRAHLAELLPTVAAQSLRPLEVIVVDGASGDGSAEVANDFGARCLVLEENRGFARAVNAGIAAAQGTRIAVLNNDLRLEADWLAHMAAHKTPFVTGKIRQWQQPQLLDGAWDALSLSGIPMRAGQGQRDSAFWNQLRQIRLAPWTAILLRRDYWNTVGPLDEDFGSYLEDVDFGLRSAKLGFLGQYEPKAVCSHRGSATLGAWHPDQVKLTARNQLRLIAKHGGKRWREKYRWNIFVGQMLWGLAAARHGCLGPWIAGKREGLQIAEGDSNWNEQILQQLDAELFEVCAATGMDRFWRLYWSLI